MKRILTIAGRELHRLEIIKYSPKFELLDGEGTDRTRAPGWDMIRDPQGVICNFKVEIFETRTDNPDYIHFMDTFFSLGSNDFVQVVHRDMLGREWNQPMYYVVDEIDIYMDERGFEYTDNFKASFIAKRGRV